MSSDNHRHEVDKPRDDPGYDHGHDGDQVAGQPRQRPYDPTPGLRKRTSILVGIAFVLLGLLMMFIAGKSAASIASMQCARSAGNADNLIVTIQENFIEY